MQGTVWLVPEMRSKISLWTWRTVKLPLAKALLNLPRQNTEKKSKA
jgi:hypothetical protein